MVGLVTFLSIKKGDTNPLIGFRLAGFFIEENINGIKK